jgi:hypothetical protein
MSKNTKKTTKKTTKTTTKNTPKTSERQTPIDDRDTAKSDDVADNQTVLNTSKNVPTDIHKINPNETESNIVYHVVQIQYPDDQTIIQKMFRVDKLPTHAVLVRYADYKKLGASCPEHVLIYSRSEKLCEAHVRRIKKQYIGSDKAPPTIEKRYQPEVFVVKCRDLGMSTTAELDPNFVEDRSWERAKNAARRLALAAKSPSAVSAASVALNTAVLSNYIS